MHDFHSQITFFFKRNPMKSCYWYPNVLREKKSTFIRLLTSFFEVLNQNDFGLIYFCPHSPSAYRLWCSFYSWRLVYLAKFTKRLWRLLRPRECWSSSYRLAKTRSADWKWNYFCRAWIQEGPGVNRSLKVMSNGLTTNSAKICFKMLPLLIQYYRFQWAFSVNIVAKQVKTAEMYAVIFNFDMKSFFVTNQIVGLIIFVIYQIVGLIILWQIKLLRDSINQIRCCYFIIANDKLCSDLPCSCILEPWALASLCSQTRAILWYVGPQFSHSILLLGSIDWEQEHCTLFKIVCN